MASPEVRHAKLHSATPSCIATAPHAIPLTPRTLHLAPRLAACIPRLYHPRTGGAARRLRGDRTLWAPPTSSSSSSGSGSSGAGSSGSGSSGAPLDRLLLRGLDRLVAHALGPRLGGASDLLWRSDAQLSFYPANGGRYVKPQPEPECNAKPLTLSLRLTLTR